MDKKVYEYISKETNDPIVEWKTCAVSGKEFAIFQSDLDFYEKISPTFNGKKCQIPTPTLCPEERMRRRLMWRNDRKLYKRQCDFLGDMIVSVYHPDSLRTIYTQKIRRSDKRDSMDYGCNFDFSKSFTKQYDKLLKDVPTIAIMNDDGLGTSENCAYCQDFAFGKNCYMTTATWLSEDCIYCDCCLQVKNCVDCIMVHNNSFNVYEGYHCTNIQNCSYIAFSTNSHDCHFCHALVGCHACFGCISLQNKQYYIFNKSYTKQEYEEELERLKQLGTDRLKKLFKEHKTEYFQESTIQRNTTHSTGSNIFDSTNIHVGFDIVDTENARYCSRINTHAKDCMDVYQSGTPILSYENVASDKSFHCAFVTWCWEGCRNLYYCDNCHTCEDCFACSGLRNKSYCIFNKQYSKEEYNKLVPKIIEHMIQTKERGEFFDSSLSPFGYNETVAQEYFPLTKEQALKRGYKRMDKEYPINIPDGMETVEASELGEYEDGFLGDSASSAEGRIAIDESILNKAIICEVSGKPFRIVKLELEFYRKHNLSLPRKHPDVRHMERMRQRPGRELFLRKCDKCWKEMLSVYKETLFTKEGSEWNELGDSTERRNPLTPFSKGGIKVYCEECYQSEIY